MERAAGEWDALEAAWMEARRHVDEHWSTGEQLGYNLQWRADLRTYETLVDRAADELIGYARERLQNAGS